MRFLIAALALLCVPAFADVTVTVSNCNITAECSFSIVGDDGPVTVTLFETSLIDWFGAGNAGPFIDTVPHLGNVNNEIRLASATIVGPVTTIMDVDDGPFRGGEVTFGGVTAPFVQGPTGTWVATVVTGPPPPPVWTGPVNLSWTPPTENEDGSPLTDLAGYVFYWGSQSGIYPSSLRVNDPAITRYTIENIPEGQWYFVATAFDFDGNESTHSNEATTTMSNEPGPGAPDGLVAEVLASTGTWAVVSGATEVYDMQKQRNRTAMPVVGDAPVGTICDKDEMHVADGELYMMVPREVVDFDGRSRDVVYALCQELP